MSEAELVDRFGNVIRSEPDKAVVEREWYFLDDKGQECYIVVVRRLKDGELFQAGLVLNQEDPMVTWDIWWNILLALKEHEGLEVILHDEFKRYETGS